jgi:hypothetical protein
LQHERRDLPVEVDAALQIGRAFRARLHRASRNLVLAQLRFRLLQLVAQPRQLAVHEFQRLAGLFPTMGDVGCDIGLRDRIGDEHGKHRIALFERDFDHARLFAQFHHLQLA